MIVGACKRAWRCHYVALALSWTVSCVHPFEHLTTLEEAEIIPGKNSDTRIKPLALANGRVLVLSTCVLHR